MWKFDSNFASTASKASNKNKNTNTNTELKLQQHQKEASSTRLNIQHYSQRNHTLATIEVKVDLVWLTFSFTEFPIPSYELRPNSALWSSKSSFIRVKRTNPDTKKHKNEAYVLEPIKDRTF
jgi:hypothetical protein